LNWDNAVSVRKKTKEHTGIEEICVFTHSPPIFITVLFNQHGSFQYSIKIKECFCKVCIATSITKLLTQASGLAGGFDFTRLRYSRISSIYL